MNAYHEPTRNALVRALSKSVRGRTRADKILLLLVPGEWVDSLSLALNGGGQLIIYEVPSGNHFSRYQGCTCGKLCDSNEPFTSEYTEFPLI
jgi:hypothetical protein